MSKSTERIVRLTHRETGVTTPDLVVTGWSDHNFDQMWDSLIRKVDFATWEPVFIPERGDDETVAEWLA